MLDEMLAAQDAVADEVDCVGECSWAQRDAALRAAAVDLEA